MCESSRHRQRNRRTHCDKKKYDYIICGNGTAGAIMARKLSDKGHSVLVLEAGKNRTTDPVVENPKTYVLDLSGYTDFNLLNFDPKYAKSYVVPLPSVPFQVNYLSEGKMWGGGSAHNYLLAMSATPELYDEWASITGDSMWSYSQVLNRIKRFETYTPNGTVADYTVRGNSGPIKITQTPTIINDPWFKAATTVTGASFISDINNFKEYASGKETAYSAQQLFVTPPFGNPNSIRSFSANEYLNDSIVTSNGRGVNGRKLKIKSESYVDKVLFKGNKAIGVQYISNKYGNTKLKKAYGKQIILCTGGINSSVILQRSGVGPRGLLESLDIPVIVDNPNVGHNLSNHYGVLSVIPKPGGFADPALNNALGTGFVDLSPYMPADGERRIQTYAVNGGDVIIHVTFMENPKSIGSVEIVDRSPISDPRLDLNMFSDGNFSTPGTDAYLAVSSFKLSNDIAHAFGSLVVSPSPPTFASDAGLFSAAQTNPNIVISSHISGTTRMGKSIVDSVVDSKLNVFGTRNLKVVDLGIAPRTPNANTCHAVYVIAETAADIMGL